MWLDSKARNKRKRQVSSSVSSPSSQVSSPSSQVSRLSIRDCPRVIAGKCLSYLPLTDRANAVVSCKLFHEASKDTLSVCPIIVLHRCDAERILRLSVLLANKRVERLDMSGFEFKATPLADRTKLIAQLIENIRLEHLIFPSGTASIDFYHTLASVKYPHVLHSLELGGNPYSTRGCAEAFLRLSSLTSLSLSCGHDTETRIEAGKGPTCSMLVRKCVHVQNCKLLFPQRHVNISKS